MQRTQEKAVFEGTAKLRVVFDQDGQVRIKAEVKGHGDGAEVLRNALRSLVSAGAQNRPPMGA